MLWLAEIRVKGPELLHLEHVTLFKQFQKSSTCLLFRERGFTK